MQFVFFKCANGETIGYFKSDYSPQGVSHSKNKSLSVDMKYIVIFLTFL